MIISLLFLGFIKKLTRTSFINQAALILICAPLFYHLFLPNPALATQKDGRNLNTTSIIFDIKTKTRLRKFEVQIQSDPESIDYTDRKENLKITGGSRSGMRVASISPVGRYSAKLSVELEIDEETFIKREYPLKLILPGYHRLFTLIEDDGYDFYLEEKDGTKYRLKTDRPTVIEGTEILSADLPSMMGRYRFLLCSKPQGSRVQKIKNEADCVKASVKTQFKIDGLTPYAYVLEETEYNRYISSPESSVKIKDLPKSKSVTHNGSKVFHLFAGQKYRVTITPEGHKQKIKEIVALAKGNNDFTWLLSPDDPASPDAGEESYEITLPFEPSESESQEQAFCSSPEGFWAQLSHRARQIVGVVRSPTETILNEFTCVVIVRIISPVVNRELTLMGEATSAIDNPNSMTFEFANIPQNLTRAGAVNRHMGWVVQGWEFSLTLGLGVAIILTLVVVFANILKINLEQYGIRRIMPSLALGIFMAYFSLFFMRVIVDVTNVLGAGMEELFNLANTGPADITLSQALANSFGIAFNPNALPEETAVNFANPGLLSRVTNGLSVLALVFISIIFWFFVIIALAIVIFELILRCIIIYLLAMVAPLAMIMGAFPMLQGWSKKWWSTFWQWAFMYPAVMLIINFASLPGRIMGMPDIPRAGGWFNLIGGLLATILLWNAVKLPSMLGGAVQAVYNNLGKSAYGGTLAWLNKTGKQWSKIDPMQVQGMGRRLYARVKKGAGTVLTHPSGWNLIRRGVEFAASIPVLPEAAKMRSEGVKKSAYYTAMDTELAKLAMGYGAAYRFTKSENAETVHALSTSDMVVKYVSELGIRRKFSDDELQEFTSAGTERQIAWGQKYGLSPDTAARFHLALQQLGRIMPRGTPAHDIYEILRNAGAIPGGAAPRTQRQEESPLAESANTPPPEAEEMAKEISQNLPEELKTETIIVRGEKIDLGNPTDLIKLASQPGAIGELAELLEEKGVDLNVVNSLAETFTSLKSRLQPVSQHPATPATSPSSETITEEISPTPQAQTLASGVQTPTSQAQASTPGESEGGSSKEAPAPSPPASLSEEISKTTAVINAILLGNKLSPRAIERGVKRFYRFGFSRLKPKGVAGEEYLNQITKQMEQLVQEERTEDFNLAASELIKNFHIEPIIEERVIQLAKSKNLPGENPRELLSLISTGELKQTLSEIPSAIDRAISELNSNNLTHAIEITKNLQIGIKTETLEGRTSITPEEQRDFLDALNARKTQVEHLIQVSAPENLPAERFISAAAESWKTNLP